MTDLLNNATKVQNECLKKIDSSLIEKSKRPHFHLASPCGWINDPNGLSFYKGQLHLFFQFHPYSNKWGPMHWGHAVTKDFLSWNFLPVALAPDTNADIDGCFSGTAMEDGDFHLIVYTGVVSDNAVQNQCIAIGDGVEYKKLENNPVITASNIPFEYDVAHFRDPKVWKENGTYYVAAVIKTQDKSGALVIFKSENPKEWKFVSVADRSECKLGMMWECPDFFSLDENDVIVISPQEMKEDLEAGWHDGNNSVFMIGKMNRNEWKFNRKSVYQIDYGIDFYAPETTLLPDGRRIMMGWMHRWEGVSTPDDYLWTGMMTLPRELKINNGIVYQNPVRELESKRINPVSGKINLFVGKTTKADGVRGRHFDLLISFEGISSDSGSLEIQIASDEKYSTKINLDFEKYEMSFDRSRSGTRTDCETFRKFKFEIPSDGKFDVRLVCDTCSAELFACGGRYAFTNVFYSPLEAEEIKFTSSKALSFDYNFYTLV